MDSHQARDEWGPYRNTIAEHLATCVDFLGRLQLSLAGEIAPDRRYFNSKASALQEAVVRLVRRSQDVERWLGCCEAEVECDHDGQKLVGLCELPAGHAGPHDDDPTRGRAEVLRDKARLLADLADDVARRLGRLAPGIDQATARFDPVRHDDLDALRYVGNLAEQLARGASRFESQISDLEASHDYGEVSILDRLDSPSRPSVPDRSIGFD